MPGLLLNCIISRFINLFGLKKVHVCSFILITNIFELKVGFLYLVSLKTGLIFNKWLKLKTLKPKFCVSI